MIKQAIIGAFNTHALSIQSFFVYIDSKFFSPKFGKLEHLTVFEDDSFKAIVFIFYFALVLGSIVIYYNRTLIGALPRALAKHECFSPESAKSLEELGLAKNAFIKFSLRFGTTFRRIIGCVDTRQPADAVDENAAESGENAARGRDIEPYDGTGKRYKNNFETDLFYIREKYKDATAIRFARKGNGILSILLTAVIGIIAVVLIFKFAPVIIEMIDSSITTDGGTLN